MFKRFLNKFYVTISKEEIALNRNSINRITMQVKIAARDSCKQQRIIRTIPYPHAQLCCCPYKHITPGTHSKNNLCSIMCLRLIFDMQFFLKRLT